MTSAILFDFGGTLDGDGLHWLDRFRAIYARYEALAVDPDRLKEAFYEADRLLEADPTVGVCGYREMMRRHARLQLRYLGLDADGLADRLAADFAGPAERALARNRRVLQQLWASGYRLGVLSNFYGNVATLCQEAGLTPFLDVILDSAVVGMRKPDPRFFAKALDGLGVAARETAMVGDSFDRDIRPARALGLRTYWVAPGRRAECPDPALVDGILDDVTALPELLVAGTPE